MAAASLLGACAAAVACSSGPSPANVGSDGAVGTTLEGEGDGAGAAASCTLMSASPATIDGGAPWGCFQTKCAMELTACAIDCACNNAFVSALQNIQAMGMSSAGAQIETAGAADTAAMAVLACTNSASCAGISGDGGPVEGGSDGATGDGAMGDGAIMDVSTGDGPPGDSAASDSATGDSPASSDAPAEGG